MARGSRRYFLNSKRKNKKTVKDSSYKKSFDEFSSILKAKGLFMRDVEGDGNCLFRAVADQLEGDEALHEKYRMLAVDQIFANREYYSLFVEDDTDINQYIQGMYENGTWAGEFELAALSEKLAVKFYIHRKDGTIFVVKSCSIKTFKKNVHLAYFIDWHYCSIRNLGDDSKAAAEPVAITLPIEEDEDLMPNHDVKISRIQKVLLEIRKNIRMMKSITLKDIKDCVRRKKESKNNLFPTKAILAGILIVFFFRSLTP